MGILSLYNHSLAPSEDYVNRYCAGETSETEDMHREVLKHICLLLACDPTELWWGPQHCTRIAERGIEAARERKNPYLHTIGYVTTAELHTSEWYVINYFLGFPREDEDQQYHVIEHIQNLLTSPHRTHRIHAGCGIRHAQETGNPWLSELKGWEECYAWFQEQMRRRSVA